MTPFHVNRRVLVGAWVAFVVAYGHIALAGVSYGLATIANLSGLGIGTVLTVRLPTNRIGSILATTAAGWTVATSADIGAERLVEAGATTAAGWIALVAMVATVPLLWLSNVALWLLFPDGRPATPRAARLLRWSAWYLVVPVTLGVFATPTVLGPGAPSVPHPFLDPSTSQTMEGPWILTTAVTFLLGFVAIAMLIARVRRADPLERRQLLVVGFGVAANLLLLLFNGFTQPFGGAEERAFLVVDAFAGAVLSIAIGVAVVRYRLFDLGRIFRRSIVYGGLAAVIAVVYITVVVVVGAWYGDGADIALSIVATVAAALVFQPARRALERWANRIVYGHRAEPQEVLARFARRAGQRPDEELLDRLPELVAQGTSARRVTVWVRSDDGFRAGAVWPADAAPRDLPAGGDGFDDLTATRSLPVFHEGELLGGLSVDADPGEDFTRAELALLDDVASALGVAMRNVRLADDLRRQVAALEASRQRLLTAADDARRDLEWSLDSGPLQRLVALKVKLEPVRLRAERLGAGDAVRVLAALESETEQAIGSIRRFAAGVYPPELESEGLAAAIRAHGAAAPFRLTFSEERPAARSDRRVGREIESAVYFTILEALQNAAKHAAAEAVTVTVRRTDGELSFEIADDGAGFEPEANGVGGGAGLVGMADRLDTVGGRLTVESRPGAGTTVSGRVPLPQSGAEESSPEVSRVHVVDNISMLNDDFGMKASAPAAMADSSE